MERKQWASQQEAHIPLRIGLGIPTWTGSFDGAPTWSDILSYARYGEEIGFDSLWVADDFMYTFDTGEKIGLWECWTLLTALATSTSRVMLGSLISCNIYRHPTLLAKIATTIDEISGGRLILGVGSGADKAQHATFGYPIDHPYSRFEEALMILSSLLRTGHADFTGTYYQVHNCELQPRGPRPTGIPLLIGAENPGPRMLRLIARYADMWNGLLVFQHNAPQDIPALRSLLDEACKDVLRTPETLQRTAMISVNMTGQPVVFGSWDVTAGSLKGSPEHLAQTLLSFAEEGISHLQIFVTPATIAGLEAFAPVLALLKKAQVLIRNG